MSSEHGTPPSAAPDDTATRFDRAGDTAYNLALRITGSPGAAWHASVAAFAAVAERIPAGAPGGAAEQDLLLMGCWHARSLLAQVAASPEYAAQLRAHDEAVAAVAPPQPAVVAANAALPVDQREVLALRGLSDLDHAALSALLRVDAGLLASMLAQSRLMLRDAQQGGDLAASATEDPEDRHALALAALRQDGQLRGPEGRERLSAWLGSAEANGTLVDALEEAGLSYRAWAPEPAPAGLRDAAVAAAALVQLPAPYEAPTAAGASDPGTTGATAVVPPASAPDPAAPDPTATDPTAVAPASAASATGDGPALPTGPAPSAPVSPRGGGAPAGDPGATVEWSSTELAALGLEGTNAARRLGEEQGDDSLSGEDEWDDAWDSGEQSGGLLQAVDRRGNAPRWQIVLVAILLVAVVVALVVALMGGDPATKESTPPSTPSRTDTTGAAPSGRLVGEIRLPSGTVRIVRA